DRLLQIDIDGDTRRVPHPRRVTTAAWAIDAWECPADLTNGTRSSVDGSLARLDQTRALVRLQPGQMRFNSLNGETSSRVPALRFVTRPASICAVSFLMHDPVAIAQAGGTLLPDHRFRRCLEACDHHVGKVEHLLDSRQ